MSARRGCSVPGCERPGPLRRGWCRVHYQRWWRTGDPGPAESLRPAHVTRHGTYNEYQNYGCRCEACKAAMSAYQRDVQATPCPGGCGRTIYGRFRPGSLCRSCRAAATRIPFERLHGTETGYSRGCRCDRCRHAMNEARRRRRAANPEAARAYDREYKRRVRSAA